MTGERRAISQRWTRPGIVGPVLFIAVFVVEGAIRSGYDPIRMQVSYLSLGDRGAIQVASFLLTALLVAAFAVGLRRRLAVTSGPGAIGGPLALGAVSLGLLIAGVFSTVPAFGYPPGTPDGFPTTIPTTAYLHVAGALLFFGGMIAAPVAMARRFLQRREPTWAWYSIATAVVVIVAFAASSSDASGHPFVPTAAGLLQRIAIVAGLAWIAALAARGPIAESGRT